VENCAFAIFVGRFDPYREWAAGAQTKFVQELTGTCQAVPAYVFACQEPGTDGTLVGWQATAQGWSMQKYPLPPVIYDRCFSGGEESLRHSAKALRAWLEVQAVRWINSPAASLILQDKIAVSDILTLAGLPIPDFEPYVGGSAQVADFLSRHPHCYLKPRSEMQGKGTLRLVGLAHGEVTVWNEEFNHTCAISALPGFLQESGADVSDSFLQAAVGAGPDALIHARPHVLKVLLQKPGAEWLAIGRKAVIDGTRTSAFTDPVEEILAQLGLPPTHARKITQQCAELAKTAMRELTAIVNGELNEASVDLVIRPDEQPFILEANSKPGKAGHHALAEAGHPDARMASLEMLVRTAVRLGS
jgi:hypothetical protein